VESDNGRVQALLPQGGSNDCGPGAKPAAAPPMQLPGASKQK